MGNPALLFRSGAVAARQHGLQVVGNLFNPPPSRASCLPAPPANLLFAWPLPSPTEHTDTPVLPQCRSTTAFFLPIHRDCLRGTTSNKLSFLAFSPQRSASQNLNLIFFKCYINKILVCAPLLLVSLLQQ